MYRLPRQDMQSARSADCISASDSDFQFWRRGWDLATDIRLLANSAAPPRASAPAFQGGALVPRFNRIHCLHGGGGWIRTSGTFRYTRFPSERTRPLCDASASQTIGFGEPGNDGTSHHCPTLDLSGVLTAKL